MQAALGLHPVGCRCGSDHVSRPDLTPKVRDRREWARDAAWELNPERPFPYDELYWCIDFVEPYYVFERQAPLARVEWDVDEGQFVFGAVRSKTLAGLRPFVPAPRRRTPDRVEGDERYF